MIMFDVVALTLKFDPPSKNFNLDHNGNAFCTSSSQVFCVKNIFFMFLVTTKEVENSVKI